MVGRGGDSGDEGGVGVAKGGAVAIIYPTVPHNLIPDAVA